MEAYEIMTVMALFIGVILSIGKYQYEKEKNKESEASIVNKRLKSVADGDASILTLDEFDKATSDYPSKK